MAVRCYVVGAYLQMVLRAANLEQEHNDSMAVLQKMVAGTVRLLAEPEAVVAEQNR